MEPWTNLFQANVGSLQVRFFYSDNGCGEQVLITEYHRKRRGRGHYQINVSCHRVSHRHRPKSQPRNLSKENRKIKTAAPSTKDLVPDSDDRSRRRYILFERRVPCQGRPAAVDIDDVDFPARHARRSRRESA